MIEPRADGHHLALPEQQVVNGLFDLQRIDVDGQIRMAVPHPFDRTRDHDVGNARDRPDPQLLRSPGLEAADHVAKVLDLREDRIDLLEDAAGLGGWDEAPIATVEQPETERGFGMFHQPAEARGRHMEELGCAGDGPGDHDGPDNLYLAQREHSKRMIRRCVAADIAVRVGPKTRATFRQTQAALRSWAATLATRARIRAPPRGRLREGSLPQLTRRKMVGGYELLLCAAAEQTPAWHQHWEFGMERRLAAIMVADIVGYSSLMEDAEEQTADEVARCQALIREKVSPLGGRVFNTAGDACLAEFGSAINALRGATEIRNALASSSDGDPLKLRIGLHLADVVVRGGDLVGDGVNVATRIQQEAEPDSICVSGVFFDNIRRNSPFIFEDLGTRTPQEPVPAAPHLPTAGGERTAQTANRSDQNTRRPGRSGPVPLRSCPFGSWAEMRTSGFSPRV